MKMNNSILGMTSLPVKTVAILFAACFAVLQMLQFEVGQSPQQHISVYHASDDFLQMASQRERNHLISILHQNHLSEKNHRVIQSATHPIHKFIWFINTEIDFLYIEFERFQATSYKNILLIGLSLELNPILSQLFSSFHSEDPPHE